MLHIIIKIILFQAVIFTSMPKVFTVNGDVDTSLLNPNEVPADGVNDIESLYKGKSLFADSGSEFDIGTETNTCPKYEM